MSLHNAWQLVFGFLPGKPVSVQPVDEDLSTDAGLLIFRQWDEQLQWTEGFARQLDDRRRKPDHSVLEMVRSRLFGILAGYEDQNDHDALRSDAIFKLLADRLPEDDDRREVRSECPRHQPSRRGNQSARGSHVARGRLRRVQRTWRK